MMLCRDRDHNRFGRLIDMVWNEIGPIPIPGVISHLLGRIQFRRTRRQPFDLRPNWKNLKWCG
jgi:hypothetical protein